MSSTTLPPSPEAKTSKHPKIGWYDNHDFATWLNFIPDLTDEELERRYAIAKPLFYVAHESGKRPAQLYLLPEMSKEDRETTSFTWEKPQTATHLGWKSNGYVIGKWDDENPTFKDSKMCSDVSLVTYHFYNSPMIFRPTVNAVLSQLPAKFFDGSLKRFYFFTQPMVTEGPDLWLTSFNNDYRAARTTLVIPPDQ